KPSAIPFRRESAANCRECISLAVSGRRICTCPNLPSCKCAFMKLHISSALVATLPAGSVATSALDMCNFMIAHLQDGKFGQVQILRPETAREMHSRQFAADSRLNGMALGFYEESRNGHRIIGHGGDTVYFHSDL